MEANNKQDKFIRLLIREKGLEKAPDHFTDKVMAKIGEEASLEAEPLLSPLSWALIILGLLTAISLLFLTDIPFIGKLFSSVGVEQLAQQVFTSQFISSFMKFFHSIHISTISITIILSVGILVILERLLFHRSTETNMML